MTREAKLIIPKKSKERVKRCLRLIEEGKVENRYDYSKADADRINRDIATRIVNGGIK